MNVFKWENIILLLDPCSNVYTGWLVTGGTSGKGVILREKRSRKYRIKIFRLRLGFRENRLWIFARYACTLSRLVITDLICCPFCRTQTSALLIKFLWTLSNVFDCFKVWKATIIFSVITRRDKEYAYRAKIQSRFSQKQSLKRKIIILYFQLLFLRRITPFPLVPPVTNHPVYVCSF